MTAELGSARQNDVVLPLIEADPVFADAVDDAIAGDASTMPGVRDRAVGRDPHDFSSLYIRHRSSFVAHARRYLSDQRDIDEVVQEALLRLFLALPELETELQALSYCRRTVTNLCIDRFRAQKRNPRLVGYDQASESDLWEDGNVDDPISAAEDAAIVREALALLSPTHRDALIKREIEEKTFAQIAAELDIPETAVKHTLHRARRSLRRALAELWAESGQGVKSALVLIMAVLLALPFLSRGSNGAVARNGTAAPAATSGPSSAVLADPPPANTQAPTAHNPTVAPPASSGDGATVLPTVPNLTLPTVPTVPKVAPVVPPVTQTNPKPPVVDPPKPPVVDPPKPPVVAAPVISLAGAYILSGKPTIEQHVFEVPVSAPASPPAAFASASSLLAPQALFIALAAPSSAAGGGAAGQPAAAKPTPAKPAVDITQVAALSAPTTDGRLQLAQSFTKFADGSMTISVESSLPLAGRSLAAVLTQLDYNAQVEPDGSVSVVATAALKIPSCDIPAVLAKDAVIGADVTITLHLTKDLASVIAEHVVVTPTQLAGSADTAPGCEGPPAPSASDGAPSDGQSPAPSQDPAVEVTKQVIATS